MLAPEFLFLRSNNLTSLSTRKLWITLYWFFILFCCSYAVPLSTLQNAGMLEHSAWLVYASLVEVWTCALYRRCSPS